MNADAAIGRELGEWFLEKAAELNSLLADWAQHAALLDEVEGWRGVGMRNCADWLVHHTGLSRPFADALLHAGRCAREFPVVSEAFSSGDLSLDKVRSISSIATPDNVDHLVEYARTASPPQVSRRCREERAAEITDDRERERAQRSERRLRIWTDELGMYRISAALPPDDGYVVRDALETRVNILINRHGIPVDVVEPDHGERALWADALAMVCLDARGGHSNPDAPAAVPAELIVHVDLDTLTRETPNGRGHLENGPAVSMRMIERLGCDARVKVLLERNGEAQEACRETRVVSEALKLKVRTRDRTCRFPGCAVDARVCDAHHITRWLPDGSGPTALWNLAAQCTRHHRAHHRGEFDIRRTPDGDLVFTTPNGHILGRTDAAHWKPPRGWRGP